MIEPIGIQTGEEFGGLVVKPGPLVIGPLGIVSEEAILRGSSGGGKTRSAEIDVSPDPNCKHCYGRGHEGRDVLTGRIQVCRCVLKRINRLRLRGEFYVHSPRGVKQGKERDRFAADE